MKLLVLSAVSLAAATPAVACDNLLADIYFRSGSTALSADARRQLDQIEPVPDGKALLVSAQTDSDGSARYNIRLSRSRAVAVEAYLMKHGIPRTRIILVAKGEGRPRNGTPPGEWKAKSRWVAVQVVKDDRVTTRRLASSSDTCPYSRFG